MCYTEVATIHLELHGAQTHCHRKRLSETSVSLQQPEQRTEDEDRRVRHKKERAHIYSHHGSFSDTHLNELYKK